jgi:hypothetical protein
MWNPFEDWTTHQKLGCGSCIIFIVFIIIFAVLMKYAIEEGDNESVDKLNDEKCRKKRESGNTFFEEKNCSARVNTLYTASWVFLGLAILTSFIISVVLGDDT